MTNVISLRNFVVEDVDDFLAWAADEEVTRLLLWDAYTSRDDAISFLTNVAIPNRWFKAICLDGKAIGSITLVPGSGQHSCVGELGYVIARKHWGKGYVAQAVQLMLQSDDIAEHGIERIQATVDTSNIRSARVLEKSGFERDGLLKSYTRFKGTTRDSFMYSLLCATPGKVQPPH